MKRIWFGLVGLASLALASNVFAADVRIGGSHAFLPVPRFLLPPPFLLPPGVHFDNRREAQWHGDYDRRDERHDDHWSRGRGNFEPRNDRWEGEHGRDHDRGHWNRRG